MSRFFFILPYILLLLESKKKIVCKTEDFVIEVPL